MPWTVLDPEKDDETFAEIDRENDRAAAILAAAVLEDRLTAMIRERLAPDVKVANEFFLGICPLATFKSRIDLAYLMQIIGSDGRKCFETIRKIRNAFVHQLAIRSFENQKIRALCNNLYTDDTLIRMRERILTTFPTDHDVHLICNAYFTALLQAPKTSRTLYMNTIKCILLSLALISTADAVEKSS